jgi:hypothetical protein
LIDTSITLTAFGSELVFNYSDGDVRVDGYGLYRYIRYDGNDSAYLLLITVPMECDGIGTTFPEAGLYVENFVPSGVDAYFVIDLVK